MLNVVHVWSHENVLDIKDLFVSLLCQVDNNFKLFMQVTDARILFLNTFADTSRNILCEVNVCTTIQ